MNSSYESVNRVIAWGASPNMGIFRMPDFSTAIPEWPFSEYVTNRFLKDTFYPLSLNGSVPLAIACVYFVSVHIVNQIVQRRQIAKYRIATNNAPLPANLKRLPAAPYAVSKLPLFKLAVLLHNIFLCVYSVVTFVGMTSTLRHIASDLIPALFASKQIGLPESFWQSICNCQKEISMWPNYDDLNLKGLTFWGYLFYLSKYYEILDTVIILLKGRPSSLLQSYHHSGAILCMWTGVRFMSPPIWIFVVFNSVIHSIMYGYFTLACLKIKVPSWFKQSLTTLQITQFVVGGSLAIAHLFVKYYDNLAGTYTSCISTSEHAMAVYVNVFYLAPLTLLFAAFYIDSYRKKRSSSSKKNV